MTGFDKEMQKAIEADGEYLRQMTGEDHGPYFLDDDQEDGGCFNCGGEGFVFDCFDGCCEDADSGCDLCTRNCDVCNPVKKAVQP
ncbi:hypothetical protein GOB02_21820 [Sinorhizobium meliloti]|nr:hypothetical protein [Sinorhizobium meliloti]